MPAFADRALLLRRFPYGESSLVCHALTRAHGRVHLLAKGAYRPTSRYYAVLDLFDSLTLEWTQTPGRELGLLQAGGLEVRRARIATDLGCYQAALTALELAGLGAPEGHANPELFDTLELALAELAAGARPDAALIEFELAFLHNLGLAPALEVCAACGGAAPPLEPGDESPARAAFSAGAGGRLCRACAAQVRAAGRRVGTLPAAVLERAADILARRTRAAALADDELELLRDFVARFLEVHLESRPASYRRFLAAPNRNRRP